MLGGRRAVACVALALLLLPAGCDDEDAESTTLDGNLTITWTIVTDPAEMQRLRDEHGATDRRVNGFSRWLRGPDGRPYGCHIWTLLPRSTDDFETVRTIRHEVKHCVEGAWHH